MGQVPEISPLMEDKVLFCQTVTYNPSTAVYRIVDIQMTESLKYSLLIQLSTHERIVKQSWNLLKMLFYFKFHITCNNISFNKKPDV